MTIAQWGEYRISGRRSDDSVEKTLKERTYLASPLEVPVTQLVDSFPSPIAAETGGVVVGSRTYASNFEPKGVTHVRITKDGGARKLAYPLMGGAMWVTFVGSVATGLYLVFNVGTAVAVTGGAAFIVVPFAVVAWLNSR